MIPAKSSPRMARKRSRNAAGLVSVMVRGRPYWVPAPLAEKIEAMIKEANDETDAETKAPSRAPRQRT
jgi:hypothetical protein